MRGFGVTIADFALEVQMDKLARLIGMDPLEFRFINAYRDGDMKAHRQQTDGRSTDRMHAGSLARRQLAGGGEVPEDVVLQGSLSHGDPARPRRCGDQLPDRHESRRRPQPGAGPLDADRQFHGHAVLRRSRPGAEAGHGADLRRDDRRQDRAGHHRHGRHRHRPALHGHLRLARHAPHRQRRHPGGEGSAAGHARSRGRGAGSRRRRPRHRRRGQYPCQGRAAEIDLDLRHRADGAFQARPLDLRPWHVPGAALLSGGRDRRDETLHLLCACLHGGRGRRRRRDRRGHRSLGQERLRDRPRAEPEDGRAAVGRRLVDGHFATRSTRRPSPTIRIATTPAPTSTNI